MAEPRAEPDRPLARVGEPALGGDPERRVRAGEDLLGDREEAARPPGRARLDAEKAQPLEELVLAEGRRVIGA